MLMATWLNPCGRDSALAGGVERAGPEGGDERAVVVSSLPDEASNAPGRAVPAGGTAADGTAEIAM